MSENREKPISEWTEDEVAVAVAEMTAWNEGMALLNECWKANEKAHYGARFYLRAARLHLKDVRKAIGLFTEDVLSALQALFRTPAQWARLRAHAEAVRSRLESTRKPSQVGPGGSA